MNLSFFTGNKKQIKSTTTKLDVGVSNNFKMYSSVDDDFSLDEYFDDSDSYFDYQIVSSPNEDIQILLNNNIFGDDKSYSNQFFQMQNAQSLYSSNEKHKTNSGFMNKEKFVESNKSKTIKKSNTVFPNLPNSNLPIITNKKTKTKDLNNNYGKKLYEDSRIIIQSIDKKKKSNKGKLKNEDIIFEDTNMIVKLSLNTDKNNFFDKTNETKKNINVRKFSDNCNKDSQFKHQNQKLFELSGQSKSSDTSIIQNLNDEIKNDNSNFYDEIIIPQDSIFYNSKKNSIKSQNDFNEQQSSNDIEQQSPFNNLMLQQKIKMKINSASEFVAAMENEDCIINPYSLKFEPFSYWDEKRCDFTFKEIVNYFFRVNNTRVSKFIYRLYDMLVLTTKIPLFKDIIGAYWVTDRIFCIDIECFSLMLNIDYNSIYNFIYGKNQFFSSHGFAEVTKFNYRIAGLDSFSEILNPKIISMFHVDQIFINKEFSTLELDDFEKKYERKHNNQHNNVLFRSKYPINSFKIL